MNKRINQAAAAVGSAALGAVILAGPALASRPDPDGPAQGTQSAQSARVHADLADLQDQRAVQDPGPRPSPDGGSPSDLPLLQVGLGVVVVGAFAAGAVGLRRRPHRPQPA